MGLKSRNKGKAGEREIASLTSTVNYREPQRGEK